MRGQKIIVCYNPGGHEGNSVGRKLSQSSKGTVPKQSRKREAIFQGKQLTNKATQVKRKRANAR